MSCRPRRRSSSRRARPRRGSRRSTSRHTATPLGTPRYPPYHGYRPLTEQALARAKADRRVLARHSRDFLDGKHAVEKDKVALEAHAEELEAKVAY